MAGLHMASIRGTWRKSKALRIACIVLASLLLLFIAGFPLGAVVKSDYLGMMRDTVLESENRAADSFLAPMENQTSPDGAVYALFNLMLHNITYIPDNDDYSKTPDEFIRDRGGDCEDFATFVSYALTKANVPNGIVVYFSLYGHAYNEFLNSSGSWQTLDFLAKPYGKYFVNKSYFHPAGSFNQTANSTGPINNPAQNSTTNQYSRATEVFGRWFRDKVLYYLLSPYYSTENVRFADE